MLMGIINSCCIPQLSFVNSMIKPLLRMDIISLLPDEIAFKIFYYLDAKALCRAAQVCKNWKRLADDDLIWHRMCEQHIDKKCTKCGWGLPLLQKKRKPRCISLPTSQKCPTPAPQLSKPNGGMLIPSLCSPVEIVCQGGPVIPRNSTSSQTVSDYSDMSGDESGLDRPSKRQRTDSNTGSSQSYARPPVPPATSSTSVTLPNQPSIPTSSRPARRLWKFIYAERLVVEFNWRRGKYQQVVLNGHKGAITSLFIDEHLLMTGSEDKTIRLWNLETGETLRVLSGHTDAVKAVQFDETKCISGSLDKTLRIWNYNTGECVRTLQGHTDGVLSLHFDDRVLSSGSKDNTIKVWNFASKECFTLRGHTDWVNKVQIYAKTKLFSCSDDQTIRMWDLGMKSCVRVFQGHVGPVSDLGAAGVHIPLETFQKLAISSRHMNVCASSLENSIIASTDVPATSSTSTSSSSACNSNSSNSASSPSNSDTPIIPLPPSSSHTALLISSSLDNTIKLWSPHNPSSILTLFGHTSSVNSVWFNSLRIISGSEDKTVKIWDLESAQCQHTLWLGSPVMAVTGSDTRVVAGGEDGSVRVWDFGMKL